MDAQLVKIQPTFEINTRKTHNKLARGTVYILRDAVCYNQGKFIEFEYLLSEKHKELKTAVRQESPSIPNTKECFDELIRYSKSQIDSVLRTNIHRFILKYYNHTKKSSFPVRVCVKMLRDNHVIDLVRSEKRLYFVDEHTPDENTGFYKVVSDGAYYLCNDIPKTAKDGNYVNPRLDQSRVTHYKIPIRNKFFGDCVDENWCNCWFRETGLKKPDWERSCYKSTLIVPMTLINNELDDEFRKRFFSHEQFHNRTIWGFLCFDHPTKDYFCEGDIDVGYIFADLLSLYFLSLHVHTEISTSYQQTLVLLNKLN